MPEMIEIVPGNCMCGGDEREGWRYCSRGGQRDNKNKGQQNMQRGPRAYAAELGQREHRRLLRQMILMWKWLPTEHNFLANSCRRMLLRSEVFEIFHSWAARLPEIARLKAQTTTPAQISQTICNQQRIGGDRMSKAPKTTHTMKEGAEKEYANCQSRVEVRGYKGCRHC